MVRARGAREIKLSQSLMEVVISRAFSPSHATRPVLSTELQFEADPLLLCRMPAGTCLRLAPTAIVVGSWVRFRCSEGSSPVARHLSMQRLPAWRAQPNDARISLMLHVTGNLSS